MRYHIEIPIARSFNAPRKREMDLLRLNRLLPLLDNYNFKIRDENGKELSREEFTAEIMASNVVLGRDRIW